MLHRTSLARIFGEKNGNALRTLGFSFKRRAIAVIVPVAFFIKQKQRSHEHQLFSALLRVQNVRTKAMTP
jgi:hypothetical protein